MIDSERFGHVLRAWALATPCVRKVSIFGSRAKGTSRSDSDLDVAVEIDPVGTDESAYVSWFHEKGSWHSELQRQLDVKLDLEWFDPAGSTPTIAKGLAEGNVVVYERAS
jgi:predicted nucleotidyltransferase